MTDKGTPCAAEAVARCRLTVTNGLQTTSVRWTSLSGGQKQLDCLYQGNINQ
jgi:hypothetical protein